MSLSSPRRIVVALIIAVVVGGVAIGATGIAPGSGSDADETPFTLPARHVGDLGTIRATYDGGEPQEDRFEWLEPGLFKDERGDWHATERFETRHAYSASDGTEIEFRQMAQVDMTTLKPVAASFGSGQSWSSGGGEESRAEVLRYTFGGSTLPCGFVNGMQQADGLWLQGSCGTGGEPLLVRFMGTVPLGEGTAWLVEGDGVRAWFAPDQPYPMRVERAIGKTLWTVELLSFARGEAPAEVIQVPDGAGIPPVEHAAPTRFGPVADADHPYPLETAIQEAHDDPSEPAVRDFMAAHPDHIVTNAEYFEKGSEDDVVYGWHFELAGEAASMKVFFTHHEYDPAPDLAPILGDLQRMDETHVATFERDHGWDCALDDLPDVPTFASIQTAWTSYADRPFEDGYRWGFRVHMCEHVEVWAGDIDDAAVSASSLQVRLEPPAPVDEMRTGIALVYGSGAEPHEVWLSEESYKRSASSPLPIGAAEAPPVNPPRDDGAPLAAALAWHMPPPATTAGVGALALLAAALYWAWPAVKGLPLIGLFSRLRQDQVPAHATRQAILSLVGAEPGIHYKQVTRRLGKGHGAVEHHLRTLEAAGLVRVLRQGGYRCYFPRSTPPARMGAHAALKAPGARALLEAVQASPGCSAKDAAARCGLSPSTVHHHLQRLREAGLVDARRVPGGLALHPLTQA